MFRKVTAKASGTHSISFESNRKISRDKSSWNLRRNFCRRCGGSVKGLRWLPVHLFLTDWSAKIEPFLWIIGACGWWMTLMVNRGISWVRFPVNRSIFWLICIAIPTKSYLRSHLNRAHTTKSMKQTRNEILKLQKAHNTCCDMIQ